jgi:periplasmic mercuric ion binding protein
MKTIILFVTAAFLAAISINSSAQAGTKTSGKQKTEAFRVWGNCDMCRDRIETGLKLQGLSKASWDKETLLVTVTYDPAKTNVDAMQKKMAAIGHDTEKYKATDEAYANLPSCCQYKRQNK